MNDKKRMKKRIFSGLCVAMLYSVIFSLGMLGWVYDALPDVLYVEQGQTVAIARLPYIAVQEQHGAARAGSTQETGSYNATLSLYGLVPVKTVRTVVSARPVVTVCGTPFGIKMLSEGALVVGFTDVNTAYGNRNPAKEAGLRLGDLIVRIGETPTSANEDVAQAIAQSAGQAVQLVYLRDEVQYTTTLTAVQNENGAWMAGMWARDSSAGVGTLTFVDEVRGVFGGLGHSISDSDTGKNIALRSGEIMDCEIVGYDAGCAGSPGELKGQFVGVTAIGSIAINSSAGLYGTMRSKVEGEAKEIAFSQEVSLGEAEIWTTIDGQTCAHYAIEIESISYTDDNRNMVIKVTDPDLLSKTGGIVQGMSGSPILQNGKLIGAVTHVFVNDPTRGYGIFIENMLGVAENIE